MEPVQEFVKLCLEQNGYFVQSDVRYVVPTPEGRVSSYADLDVVAVRIDASTGRVTDKLWGEVKAHLTLSLTPSYLRHFATNYATLLDLSNEDLRLGENALEKLRIRQWVAEERATAILGAGYRRILFFAGKRATEDSLAKVKQLLLPDTEVRLVEDMVPFFLGRASNKEDNEPIVRIIIMLRTFGHLSHELEETVEDGQPGN
jgi:hypothetical protein